jgi:HSP20 family protein
MHYKRNFGVMPGFFENALQHGWNNLAEEANLSSVPVNIQETDKSYELHVVAAGLKKEDFKLNIDRNILNISFEQKEENKEQEGKWLRKEYAMKSFKRSFTLNDKVDAANISAKYSDGILDITLPKKEVSEPTTHDIQVN